MPRERSKHGNEIPDLRCDDMMPGTHCLGDRGGKSGLIIEGRLPKANGECFQAASMTGTQAGDQAGVQTTAEVAPDNRVAATVYPHRVVDKFASLGGDLPSGASAMVRVLDIPVTLDAPTRYGEREHMRRGQLPHTGEKSLVP